jgi:S1-C subfamily serine protease
MTSAGSENSLAALSNAMVQAVEKAASFTVLVDARKRQPASGVAYSNDLVLTADHVVEREENIHILLPDGSQVSAALAGRDPSSDLALLRLPEARLNPAPVSSSEGSVGQLGLVLARPSSEGVQAGLALISAIGGPVRTRRGGLLPRYFRLDAVPYPGFSGGPLLDGDGNVLGINTSGLAGGAFLTLPASQAWEISRNPGETRAHQARFSGGTQPAG